MPNEQQAHETKHWVKEYNEANFTCVFDKDGNTYKAKLPGGDIMRCKTIEQLKPHIENAIKNAKILSVDNPYIPK